MQHPFLPFSILTFHSINRDVFIFLSNHNMYIIFPPGSKFSCASSFTQVPYQNTVTDTNHSTKYFLIIRFLTHRSILLSTSLSYITSLLHRILPRIDIIFVRNLFTVLVQVEHEIYGKSWRMTKQQLERRECCCFVTSTIVSKSKLIHMIFPIRFVHLWQRFQHIFQCSVHTFHLTVSLWMVRSGLRCLYTSQFLKTFKQLASKLFTLIVM